MLTSNHVNNELIKFRRQVISDFLRRSRFDPFMGDTSTSVIVRMADLEAKLVAADAVPLALTWSHAVKAYDIAPHHRDPFDRLLLAQAVTEPLHLLTTDEALKSYSSFVIVV